MRIAVLLLTFLICTFYYANNIYASEFDENLLFRQPKLQALKTDYASFKAEFELFKNGNYRIIVPKIFNINNFSSIGNSVFYSVDEKANVINFSKPLDSNVGEKHILEVDFKDNQISGLFMVFLFEENSGQHFILQLPIDYEQLSVGVDKPLINNFGVESAFVILMFVSIIILYFVFRLRSKVISPVVFSEVAEYRTTFRSPQVVIFLLVSFLIFSAKAFAQDDIFVVSQLNPRYESPFSLPFSGILENEESIEYFCELKKAGGSFQQVFSEKVERAKVLNEVCNFDSAMFVENGNYQVRVVVITQSVKYFSESQEIYFEKQTTILDLSKKAKVQCIYVFFALLILVTGVFIYRKIKNLSLNKVKLPQIN
jgi:hypothetical protein